MVRRKASQLWIKYCAVKDCDNDGKRWHYHRLNPKGQAMKAVEMTVLRGIRSVVAFDKLDKDEDWSMVPSKEWIEILGDKRYTADVVVLELWARYKSWRLHQQVLDLSENLILEDMSDNNRKEIQDGLNGIRKSLNSRRKR